MSKHRAPAPAPKPEVAAEDPMFMVTVKESVPTVNMHFIPGHEYRVNKKTRDALDAKLESCVEIEV